MPRGFFVWFPTCRWSFLIMGLLLPPKQVSEAVSGEGTCSSSHKPPVCSRKELWEQ